MLVTLEEMKNYLRVDDDEDDGLITTLLGICGADVHGHPADR